MILGAKLPRCRLLRSRGDQLISVFEGESLEEAWGSMIEAFQELQNSSLEKGSSQPGRGGSTLELLHSVIHIKDPRQRWAYSRRPAMNPAFALAEVIWILAGRQDSGFINYWNPILPQFAGKGPTYYGAYGHRLRHAFGIDQLQRAYETLRYQPDSRQVVLQIWEPKIDLPRSDGTPSNPDIPCNISSLLKVRNGRLEWTQIMRSNDLYRGLPHNIVQWTCMQEVLAGWLGLEVGSYVHLSDSLHVYETHWDDLQGNATFGNDVEFPHNTDSLALAKDEFDVIFPEIEARARQMTDPDLQADALLSLPEYSPAPASYRNVLRVLAADSARRRGGSTLCEDIMAGCDNPALTYLWQQWDLRRKSQ